MKLNVIFYPCWRHCKISMRLWDTPKLDDRTLAIFRKVYIR